MGNAPLCSSNGCRGCSNADAQQRVIYVGDLTRPEPFDQAAPLAHASGSEVLFETDNTEGQRARLRRELAAALPLSSGGTPEDIAFQSPFSTAQTSRSPFTAAQTFHTGEAPKAATTSPFSTASTRDGQKEPSCASSSVGSNSAAQKVIKTFVRAMVKGAELSVLTTAGGIAQCNVVLDRKLTTMTVQRAGNKDGKKRSVPLERIVQVAVGEEASGEVLLKVDDMCVTLLLEDSQAIGFRFRDIEERDTFALCLAMFVDGRRAEVERKQQS
mmetsp:Transcript_79078/g.219726  ORF Transcript_79078/g.219726 Transcript_79078/m.219726 type:complete len:271 (+) Transcript_79078:117-929(+)